MALFSMASMASIEVEKKAWTNTEKRANNGSDCTKDSRN